MLLRSKPDDFLVEELPSVDFKPSGRFAVYRVSKINLTTFAAEKVLAKHCCVPFKKIGFAGLKDARARTVQYFSVETDKPELGVFSEQGVVSVLAGFVDSPLRTGDLSGNKFVITVRDLPDDKAQVSEVLSGVPNYFDSQRFGSLKGVSGFIAKDVLLGDFESAVKKMITPVSRHLSPAVRSLRRRLTENWGDWFTCADFVRKGNLEKTSEGTIVLALFEGSSFKEAFHLMFKGVREIFFSAYQSFIWNECVKRLVMKSSVDCYGVDYVAGRIVFPGKWRVSDLGVLPTVSAVLPESKYRAIIDLVLKDEKISLETFNTDEHIFVSRERSVTVVPSDFSIEFSDDEQFSGRKKAVVKFALQKGSYATIVLKALFKA